MPELKGAILVLTYSRAQLLDELLTSINRINAQANKPLIVVRQKGHDDVGQVLAKWVEKINVLIETDGSAETAADNIGRNRLAGHAVAFESLGVDWVLAVEDDVVLASDSILFTEFVMKKYFNNRNFRGINLGSRLPRSQESENSFCKTRFGIYGQGAVLPVTSWNKMKKLKILKAARKGHWDSAMQAFMRTGFTIAPNCSRYIDRGWGGTHASQNSNEDYFKDVRNSFADEFVPVDNKYEHRNLGYFWREDLKIYKAHSNPFHWVKFLILHPLTIQIYQKIFR